MYYYLLFLVGSSVLYFSKNIIKNNYQLIKIRKINFKSLKFILRIFIQLFYISFIQKIAKNIQKIDKNSYELSYIINNKLYKLKLKIQKGPSPILQIINNDDDDITYKILPYLGPDYNFNGIKYTPRDFDTQELTFNLINGKTMTFKKNDIIELKY